MTAETTDGAPSSPPLRGETVTAERTDGTPSSPPTLPGEAVTAERADRTLSSPMLGGEGASPQLPSAAASPPVARTTASPSEVPGAATVLELRCGQWAALGKAASEIRLEVFVREQGVPLELECDEMDASSIHCVAFVGERAVATGRLLPDGHIGRMAVLAPWRRAGLGGLVLERLVALAAEHGHRVVRLNAQQYVEPFYCAHGFTSDGPPFAEAGIVHVAMWRALD